MVADGQDAVLLTVTVVDSDGNVIHASEDQPWIEFVVTGPGKLIGLGSGDPSDHQSEKSARRRAFNGLLRAVVQTARAPLQHVAGEHMAPIEVVATASGLKPANLVIGTSAPRSRVDVV